MTQLFENRDNIISPGIALQYPTPSTANITVDFRSPTIYNLILYFVDSLSLALQLEFFSMQNGNLLQVFWLLFTVSVVPAPPEQVKAKA